MSKSHNRHFFYHKETNTTVWDKPSSNEKEKEEQDIRPASPPLAQTTSQSTQRRSNQDTDLSGKPLATGKVPPTGPSERKEHVRGVETKPHYDKYWAQRDVSYQAQTQAQHQERMAEKEKRRAREPSPIKTGQEYKRFRGDNDGNESRRQPELKPLQDYKPAQPSPRPSDTSSVTTDKPKDDPRTRPYNGAYVPPVVRHHNPHYTKPSPRSPTGSRGSATPSYQPNSGPKYQKDFSRPPPSADYRKDDYSRPPPSARHDSATYTSRGPPISRGEVDEAEIERAKIRDEARKAQEKLEFLKQAEARLEREMSEKRRPGPPTEKDNYSRSSRPSYDRPGPPSDIKRSYPPRERDYPPSQHHNPRYDKGSDSRYEGGRGGYQPEATRGGGYDNRSSGPPRGYDNRPPPRGGYDDRSYQSRPPPFRPNSPPPPSSRYADAPREGRRSPPPFGSRSGPRPDSPPRRGDRDLASRLGGGRGRSELAAEPMSAQAIDRERDRRSPPPSYRDRPRSGPGPSRPLAERMSFDDRRGPR
ncbi:uncharacterized protein I206_101885 [Kwoniella pini CBS 10737]|uniref:WW domain-containing protein n=1 Tax=Kwoniella pini CBS 10737 TaxID=1296096 RepID=A0A1B9HVF3_9TREE|nr:uncharacterized protein I206_07024 [Kwoniella pini CBS 10737]OCF47246.1 hypothetical protein I206_07024 [Kwoniella pini CBS 10737]